MIRLIDSSFNNRVSIDLDGIDMPLFAHVYGCSLDYSAEPFWMRYASPFGSLTFSRFLYKKYPDFTKGVAEYLNGLFKSKIKFYHESVNIFYTEGDIVPHRDESGRVSSINIGLKNSDVAITSYSPTNTLVRYHEDKVDFQCVDGATYLLNTSNIHAVSGPRGVCRYMITYSLGIEYATVLDMLKQDLNGN